ncbi:MAG: FadR/GntR family transcriptional regulator [Nocardioides sp.]
MPEPVEDDELRHPGKEDTMVNSSNERPQPGALSRQNLSQAIVEGVLGWIAEGRYAPGQFLPTERELMSHFDVGRNTVREAMQAMVSMGVISVRPGRGTEVLSMSPTSVLPPDVVSALMQSNTLQELYEFRLVLEPGIAAFAADRATEHDVEAMAQALEQYEYAMRNGDPVSPHDILFHRQVAAAAHNAIYLKMIDAVSDLLVSARRATDLIPTAVQSAAADHRAILEAIVDNDRDRASELMAAHVLSGTRALTAISGLTRSEQHAEVDHATKDETP